MDRYRTEGERRMEEIREARAIAFDDVSPDTTLNEELRVIERALGKDQETAAKMLWASIARSLARIESQMGQVGGY